MIDRQAPEPKASRHRPVPVAQDVPANVMHEIPETSPQVSPAVSGLDPTAINATTPPISRASEPMRAGDSTSPFIPKPARGYSWAPFVDGNTAAQTHGMYSARNVEPIARQIAADLRATDGLDYLDTPRFREALWTYAMAAAKAELVQRWLNGMTPAEQFTATRGKDSPSELLRQMQGHAGRLGDRIGLFPVVADDVADDIAASRKTLARRAERKALQADHRSALREQVYGDRDAL